MSTQQATRLAELLATIQEDKFFFTVSAPVIIEAHGTEHPLISISLQPQNPAQTPLVKSALPKMASFFQKVFSTHSEIKGKYIFHAVHIVEVIINKDHIFRKWQITAQALSDLPRSASSVDTGSHIGAASNTVD